MAENDLVKGVLSKCLNPGPIHFANYPPLLIRLVARVSSFAMLYDGGDAGDEEYNACTY
jgi:hypothetical protein